MKDHIKSKTASDYGEIATNETLRMALQLLDEEYAQEITDKDVALLNEIVYGDYEIFKNLTLRRYYWLRGRTFKGNTVASCIIVDIDTAIEFANFTAKELKILKMWMQGFTQVEIAEAVYDYQRNVSRVIDRCVRRLQYILVYLNPYR